MDEDVAAWPAWVFSEKVLDRVDRVFWQSIGDRGTRFHEWWPNGSMENDCWIDLANEAHEKHVGEEP